MPDSYYKSYVSGLGIRPKLALAMALIAFGPLTLTALGTHLLVSSRLEKETGELLRETAGRTADLVSQSLLMNVDRIETYGRSQALISGITTANRAYDQIAPRELESELRARDEAWRDTFNYSPQVIAILSDEADVNPVGFEIHRFRGELQHHVELVATDLYGGLVAATSRTRNFYFGDEAWWQAAIAGQIYVGPPVEDADTGVTSLTLGVPIQGEDGAVIGALSSSLDIVGILGILRRAKLGKTGILRIYDASGTAIFDPGTPRLGTAPLPEGLEAQNVLQAERPGWLRADSTSGEDTIHGHARPSRNAGVAAIDQLDWTTVASQSTDEALATVHLYSKILAGVVVAATLLAILGALVLSPWLTAQLDHITWLIDEISRGNYKARAEVESRDELGEVTTELNTWLDDTMGLIQSREERDAIQASVVRLLEEVADVAQGDLTVRAEVTPDITGAIADSFNYMITELRRIIGNVQNTSSLVTTTAASIRSRMEDLAAGSGSQSQQILEASERIRQMASSIQQVSKNASQCSNVAGQSLSNAQQGTLAVSRTISGMTSIRNQVREASKRLKRLGESSQEIGQIVKLIGEISDRTSILALNASIQAAAAGEAGDSFAVVADEIELLAERSAEASQRIETLIKTVQVETAEAMAAMEDTTHEVIGGSELANNAGQALEKIGTVSQDLAALVSSISDAAAEQARSSEAVASSMDNISQITQQAAFATRQASNEADSLASQADDLRSSVDRFTVPAKAKVA